MDPDKSIKFIEEAELETEKDSMNSCQILKNYN
jgi:hypothetical protein